MKKHLLVALSVLCLCSCFEKKKVVEKPKENIVAKQETKPASEKNDKYVYIDEYNCLHTKKDCLWHINQENWERPTHAIIFIQKNKLLPYAGRTYCRKCVDAEDYEELRGIMTHNYRKRIYNRLSKSGYDCGDTFEEFDSILMVNRKARRWVYEINKYFDSSCCATDAFSVEAFASDLDIPCDFYRD